MDSAFAASNWGLKKSMVASYAGVLGASLASAISLIDLWWQGLTVVVNDDDHKAAAHPRFR